MTQSVTTPVPNQRTRRTAGCPTWCVEDHAKQDPCFGPFHTSQPIPTPAGQAWINRVGARDTIEFDTTRQGLSLTPGDAAVVTGAISYLTALAGTR